MLVYCCVGVLYVGVVVFLLGCCVLLCVVVLLCCCVVVHGAQDDSILSAKLFRIAPENSSF